MKTTLEVTGMHCQACAQRLTAAFRQVPGVQDARVSLSPPRAELESATPIPIETLSQAARAAGDYAVREASPHAPTPAPSPTAEPAPATSASRPSLYPLILIVAFITGVASLTTFVRGSGDWRAFMNDFMAGFFLVFSFFKLLDLRGFAGAYRSYDIITRAWPAWGFIYPFVELALGVAYLIRFAPMATNVATLVLMLVGSVGVLRALLDKRAIRCACLGTALNLPMTTVTLVEDLGMAAMAAVMLAAGH